MFDGAPSTPTPTHSPATTASLTPVPITVAEGDGIGPEIMEATLRVLEAAGAALAVERIEIGARRYLAGASAGIDPASWDSLRRTRVFLKAPISTPQGGGYKSLNVTARKTLGLFANVRPCVAYHPFVETRHPGMDVVIVRENEEDTYGGIEHRQTAEVTQCLKLISRPGCERIVRYAFDYARRSGRQKVTCMTKDNIMKITDGLFHQVFAEIGAEYPEIEQEHRIIDIGAARLATRPEDFDVIVTPNLYGDIISDIAAELAGSIGLAGSANIGRECAMFEAIHGSAPDIAGQGLANPSGLLLAAVMMLVHIDQAEVAGRVHNAWLRTLEDGIHTPDVHRPGKSRRRVGTRDFASAVIDRLGSEPRHLRPVNYRAPSLPEAPATSAAPAPAIAVRRPVKELRGVDVFVEWDERGRDPAALARLLALAEVPPLRLSLITNRGVKVHPGGFPETSCTDHWRCRFVADGELPLSPAEIIALLRMLHDLRVDVIKTENLYAFDGERGYSLGQGE
ncbi:MAG: NADP-dependent isocitrate dehydrogenase [Myxococcales bacterium]|nr:NADP-dependent isocitrate dehydrogenase [Myxococcales bacterium]MCB9703975.1 NADP-dependent isocitrate dehydrogenase [Myxococcales bacterium]